jgi:hypothetical protein
MMMTMADTFRRATNNDALAEEMKSFASSFFKKFRDEMIKDQS